jgi:hypothetical protein
MGSEVQLRVWQSGEYSLVSEGQDGSQTLLDHYGSGIVRYVEVDDEGWRKTVFAMAREDGSIDTALLEPVDNPPHTGWLDPLARAELRNELGDGFFGEWKVGPPIVKHLPDGGVVTIIREGDGTGHYWERGVRTEGRSATTLVPERTWLKSWHPTHDPMHPKAASGVREATEWGRVKEPKGFHGGGHTNYTKTTITYPAGAGGGRHTIVDQSSFNPTTGDREHSVTIKHADGTQSRSWTRTTTDGSWHITTITTDEHGRGQKHVTEGKGDKVTKDKTEDVDQGDSEGESGSEEQGDADPPDKDSPVGDGDTGGYQEGNPDGPWDPFDKVALARLIGEGWEGTEDLDTLGDLEGLMRPWMDRLIATAGSGAGSGSPGELLDTLGAPPEIDELYLTGVEYDELADHDSLGRPPPIFGGTVETTGVDAGEAVTSAATISELVTIAEGLTGAAEAAGSLDLLRTTP